MSTLLVGRITELQGNGGEISREGRRFGCWKAEEGMVCSFSERFYICNLRAGRVWVRWRLVCDLE